MAAEEHPPKILSPRPPDQYEGELSALGERHGVGTYWFETGCVSPLNDRVREPTAPAQPHPTHQLAALRSAQPDHY